LELAHQELLVGFSLFSISGILSILLISLLIIRALLPLRMGQRNIKRLLLLLNRSILNAITFSLKAKIMKVIGQQVEQLYQQIRVLFAGS